MLIIQNMKNFQIGETVKALVDYDGLAVFEGRVLYVHPTNGWLTMAVEKIHRQYRYKEGDGIATDMNTYQVLSPFPIARWFSSAYHINERITAAEPMTRRKEVFVNAATSRTHAAG